MTVNEAVCEALFASPLQRSDALTAETVAEAIGSTVRRLGAPGCASHMAQEFGDHPAAAANRMRWIRQPDRRPARLHVLPDRNPAGHGTRNRPADGL